MSEDEAAEDGAEEPEPVDLEAIREALEAFETDVDSFADDLEAADTEDDLDVVEAGLEAFRDDIEEIEIPEPPEPDEDEEDDEDDEEEKITPEEELQDRYDDIESDLSDLESDLEDQRGPYGEDVVSEIEDASGTITSTRWTVEGDDELIDVVDAFLEETNDLLDSSLTIAEDGEDVSVQLEATLEEATTAVEDAGLDADDDAETIANLLEATDDLETGIDESTAWTDLKVREQMRREGYYDVLEHVKDFPPEWHALKVHEKRGNVDMILLALETFDSDFMEEHCLETLERMGPKAAIEPMIQKANRRDTTAMSILGKIGVDDEEVVDTLLDYVDSNPTLQQPAFRALGEVGAEDAVQPIANQLIDEEPDVRSSAARALGLIGDTRAIDPLEDILAEDDEDRVRASAAWALNQIGTEDALEIVAEYGDDRAYLVQAEAEKVTLEPAA